MSDLSAALIRPALDLRYRHFEARVGDIIVIGTWLRESAKQSQPCLVLLHARRPIAAGKTVPCVIPQNEAWRWVAGHKGDGDPAHCVARCVQWLACGYLPGDATNKRDLVAIVDAVNSRLTDLKNMPPRPPVDRAAIADVILTNRDTGETISETEIRDDV